MTRRLCCWLLSAFILVALAAFAAPPAALAATFRPTRFDDPPPDGCLSNDCSLREAVIDANAQPDADRIELAAGVYTLSIQGRDEDAALTGDLDITFPLEIEGAGPDATVIDAGDLDRAVHVIAAPGAPVDVTLARLRLRDGLAAPSLRDDGGRGGAVYVSADATLVLDEADLRDSSAGLEGGALYVWGEVAVTGSTVRDNAAAQDGGGVYALGPLSITGSTLSGNSAARGGALLTLDKLTMLNSTVSGNAASGIAGGVFVDRGEASLRYSTIASNTSQVGSGANLAAGGAVVVEGTIIAGAGANNCGGELISLGHNVESGAACGLAAPGDIMGADPRLGMLADNGGPVRTRALLPGSPAIDAATNDRCPAHDQRNVARPQDGDAGGDAVCDIGAFELVGPAPPCHLRGDVNDNGLVSAVDVALVLQRVAALIGPLQCDRDVNGDGRLTSLDALYILWFVAGLIEDLP